MSECNDEFCNEPMPLHLAQMPDYFKSELKKLKHPELRALADRTGVSFGNLRLFIDGQTRNPTLRTLVALCEEFKIKVDLIPTVGKLEDAASV